MGEAIRQALRRRQHVAEIVVDLGHGDAERCQTRLLMERGAQCALHIVELLLRDADLVAASRGLDDPGPVFRIVAKGDHVLRQAAHRHHHHPDQRQVYETGRDRRDHKAQAQNAPAEGAQLFLQRRLVHDQLDQGVRDLRRPADHSDHSVLLRNQTTDRVADQREETGLPQIVARLDAADWLLDHQHQLAGTIRFLKRNRVDSDVTQNLPLYAGIDHVGRTGLEGQDPQVPGRQLLFQVGQPVTPHGWRENQDLRQHDKKHRQNQETGRQTARGRGQ